MVESGNIIPLAAADLSSLPDDRIPSVRVDAPEFLELRRKRALGKQRGRFVLGPIVLEWIGACEQAGPGALALAMAVRAHAKMRGVAAVPVSDALARQVGLGNADRRRRALAALEAAGLVRVERKPGCAPLAAALRWPSKKTA